MRNLKKLIVALLLSAQAVSSQSMAAGTSSDQSYYDKMLKRIEGDHRAILQLENDSALLIEDLRIQLGVSQSLTRKSLKLESLMPKIKMIDVAELAEGLDMIRRSFVQAHDRLELEDARELPDQMSLWNHGFGYVNDGYLRDRLTHAEMKRALYRAERVWLEGLKNDLWMFREFLSAR